MFHRPSFWILLLAMYVPPAAAQIDLRLTQVTNIPTVVELKAPRDGSERLFAVQQSGSIRILQRGELLPLPFLSIGDRTAALGEQGLLSMAFDPEYETNRRFYVLYTNLNGDTVISRFLASADDPQAAIDDEEVLITFGQPFTNHNGGRLQFGPDGMLYISLGDGGGAGDPNDFAQNPGNFLGSILRIDVSGESGYTVPPDNPFVETEGFAPETWAYGLRNPWRISFDRLTGDLYIADVGQQLIEEVNFQPAGVGGQNYGWNRFEGSDCFSGSCDTTGLTFPVLEYDHNEGCSITGGEVYRGQDYPAMFGHYFYGDFCTGMIWASPAGGNFSHELLLDTALNITTFGSDEVGNLYVADRAGIYLLSDGAPKTTTRPLNGEMSGTYVVEGLPDQGFFVQVGQEPPPSSRHFLFVAWFTYRDGAPYWLAGNAFFEPGDASVELVMQELEGPGFLDFSGENATRNDLGTMRFTALHCDGFEVVYDLGADGAGTLMLDRLTGIEGYDCEPDG